ncbi:MAG: hypothetical protein JNL83_36845 [Myxococcales bacterium]|nr:hypothetical protein [Myxococcales bacterium]
MKHLSLLALITTVLSTGCIIRTRNHHHHRGSARASCPPAHHWENGACVHNGRGRGNGNGKGNGPVIRDHR